MFLGLVFLVIALGLISTLARFGSAPPLDLAWALGLLVSGMVVGIPFGDVEIRRFRAHVGAGGFYPTEHFTLLSLLAPFVAALLVGFFLARVEIGVMIAAMIWVGGVGTTRGLGLALFEFRHRVTVYRHVTRVSFISTVTYIFVPSADGT